MKHSKDYMTFKKKLGLKGETKPGDLKDAMEKGGFKRKTAKPAVKTAKSMVKTAAKTIKSVAKKPTKPNFFQKMLEAKAKKGKK